MSKQRLQAARELIQQKKYAEARRILKGMDDPTAQKWLAKLDEIAPEHTRSKQNRVLVGVIALMLVVILILVVLLFIRGNANTDTTNIVIVTPTQDEASIVQLPTVMDLPSATPTNTMPPPTVTPTDTPFPTETFTQIPSSTYTLTTSPTPTLSKTSVPTSTPTPECNYRSWWGDVEELVTEFLDTAEVASSTSRMALSPIVLEMQRTFRDFERIDTPSCLFDIEHDLEFGMRSVIDGFNSFLAQDGISTQVFFTVANQQFWNVYNELIQRLIIADGRLLSTHLIWGGDEASEIEATAMQVREPTLRAEVDATLDALLTPSPTSVRCTTSEAQQSLTWAEEFLQLLAVMGTFQASSDIQAARDALAALPYPACISNARALILNGFDQLYNATISSTPSTQQQYLDNAFSLFEQALAELAMITGATR
jgi:hypothetical protein